MRSHLSKVFVSLVSVLLTMLFLASCVNQSQATPVSADNCKHDDSTFRCVKILKNYDGDTLTADIPNVPALLGKNISVRVFGIDTPEVKTKNSCEKEAGRIAKNLVTATLKNAKNIELHNVQRDKYFRILADVIVDGRSLKDILLKNNLAYEYDGGTKKHLDWCKVIRRPANN